MTPFNRSSRWAAALALGLAGLIGVGAALVLAGPARTAASPFEPALSRPLGRGSRGVRASPRRQRRPCRDVHVGCAVLRVRDRGPKTPRICPALHVQR